MINLTTSLQIRGWMSLTVLSEYITIPGQVFSIGRWQIGSCIHQWIDRDVSCSHLLPSFIIAWRSLICMFPLLSFCCVTLPRAKTFVQLEAFSSSLFFRQTTPDLGYLVVILPWWHMGVQHLCLDGFVFYKASICISIKLPWIQLLPNKITEMLLSCDPVLADRSVLNGYYDCSLISFHVIH